LTPPLLKEPEDREKKPDFTDLPPGIFRQLEKLCAAKITATDVVYGGLSAAACYVMTFDTGRRVFVKGTHPGEMSHGAANLAQEVLTYETMGVLRDVAPPYLGIVSDGDEDGWMLGVWEYEPHDEKLFNQRRVLEIMPLWQGEPMAENSLPHVSAHVYLAQFFNGEKKWLRMKNDANVRPKFAALFADATQGAAWLERNVDVLVQLQAKADKMTGPEGLLHGDLRIDNFLFTPDRTYVCDWPNACFGPLVFDLAFLFSNLEALGLGRTEELFYSYKGMTIPENDKVVMLASLSGYFADHAYREIPKAMPRLRWMQQGMLLAQLKSLARMGIIESPPRMAGENQ